MLLHNFFYSGRSLCFELVENKVDRLDVPVSVHIHTYAFQVSVFNPPVVSKTENKAYQQKGIEKSKKELAESCGSAC
uniref:Uncharacterized protein n=1 Tax=Ditylenchus dipsaci TaxID=166011 RepID=A0A915CZ46_9BILA